MVCSGEYRFLCMEYTHRLVDEGRTRPNIKAARDVAFFTTLSPLDQSTRATHNT